MKVNDEPITPDNTLIRGNRRCSESELTKKVGKIPINFKGERGLKLEIYQGVSAIRIEPTGAKRVSEIKTGEDVILDDNEDKSFYLFHYKETKILFYQLTLKNDRNFKPSTISFAYQH